MNWPTTNMITCDVRLPSAVAIFITVSSLTFQLGTENTIVKLYRE